METNQILKKRRRDLRLSQEEAGKLIGVSQQHYQRLENGYPMTLDIINKIAEVFGLPKSSLLPEDCLPAHMGGVNLVADKISGAVSSFFKKTQPDTVGIEMLDVSACCGLGKENLSEKVVGVWQMPLVDFKGISQTSPENIKIVKAVGDSMQPTINDGDFVFVDISNQSMGSDGIYVLSSETGLSIKRLQNEFNGKLTINSDNQLYKSISLPLGEIHILGRVVNIVNLRKI